MRRDASHLLGRFGERAFFVAVALACICACLLLGAVRPAFAEESQTSSASQGVTRSVEGVNYTLPVEWQALPIPQALVSEMGLSALEAYTHEDGFFAAAAIPGSVSGVDLEEVQTAATEIAEELSELEYLPGMVGLPIAVGAATEQGWPALTFYTDDIMLNGVTYGLTAKLFFVSDRSFEGVVAMLSFLPASGVVTEDFAHSFPVLEQEQAVDVAGAPYVVPAGSTLAQGSVFGIDFACAWRDVAAMIAIDLPLVGADEVTVDMLDELAYSLAESTSSQPEISSLLQSFWADGYQVFGLSTLGIEITADPMGTGSWYSALMVHFSGEGIGLVEFVEPLGEGYAEETLVASGALPAQNASSQGVSSGSEASSNLGGGADANAGADAGSDADESPAEDELGFVVGLAA